MGELRSSEIHWVVHQYIGVEGGYLGDFSYRTHREFYSAFCDLDLDLDSFGGNTTRERFLAVLSGVEGHQQAAILRGIAKKYPQGGEHFRTPQAYQKLLELAKRCADGLSVQDSSPAITSDVLKRALADANTLIQSSGPTHAVDRIHTALHAYLKAVCHAQGIDAPSGATITNLFKLLRNEHPGLRDLGSQSDTMNNVLRSLSNVIDCLNPVRNNASLAHANEELLGKDEAMLAINAARTVFQYLDSKFS
ncbi:abortive infection family protein [Pseudoxanthomonas winnipegensis]|uniref:HEPN domain-containing protein n=1 Tax=Pseudoxanthomonas winnipegensis TaxID=2480810 RepID=A0A4V2HFI7_9GAMM|nr:abortive infection family protein [Pseudoxanthomonas winnipegensis]RZZ86983.1 HEPN domain-containing protein [Pseudoxanthomonas winnipegensis]TAA37801.1 HEPN domain-containing protein [Pseudoxanthomonas winnipegensis]TBV76422.1 HEPN domain-containing protein [Pseudoxanthomonas winnipegensis]